MAIINNNRIRKHHIYDLEKRVMAGNFQAVTQISRGNASALLVKKFRHTDIHYIFAFSLSEIFL